MGQSNGGNNEKRNGNIYSKTIYKYTAKIAGFAEFADWNRNQREKMIRSCLTKSDQNYSKAKQYIYIYKFIYT